MSTRALRRFQEEQRKNRVQKEPEDDADTDAEEYVPQSKSTSLFSNSLLEDFLSDGEADEVMETYENYEKVPDVEPSCSKNNNRNVAVKKKKKKKRKNVVPESAIKERERESKELDTDEELDKIIAEKLQNAEAAATLDSIEDALRDDMNQQACSAKLIDCLSIDSRCLLAENEMVRMFGSEVLHNMNKQKRAHKQNANRSQFKLAKYPSNMSPIPKFGLSMEFLDRENGDINVFKFVHSKEYQSAQIEFWRVASSIRSDLLVKLLEVNPFHLDTLLQTSNVFRINEDTQQASALIERCLCAAETAFHPLFSVTNSKSRLPYKYPENRSLYIAMFYHVGYLTKKGCHRTALEFCKLILSLAPDEDPLSILLLIDSCALMSRQYKWLKTFYKTWNPTKNLHQLPNFAFSVVLADFLVCLEKSSSENTAETWPTEGLEEALISFPSVLPELLNLCNIDADAKTERNHYFGMSADANQLQIVTCMCKLYANRVHHIWKQPEVMKWLERATKRAIERVNSKDLSVEKSVHNRKTLYKGTPRNIFRHFILSDVKDVNVALPVGLQRDELYSYDPLPPPNTVRSYERPASPVGSARYPAGRSLLSTIAESLYPLYGLERAILEEAGVGGFEMRPPIEVMGEAQPAEVNHEAEHGDALYPVDANVRPILRMLRDMLRRRTESGGDAEIAEMMNAATTEESDDENDAENAGGAVGGALNRNGNNNQGIMADGQPSYGDDGAQGPQRALRRNSNEENQDT